MTDLTNLLLGFQIGFLFTASHYAWKIKKLPTSPSFAYNLAIIALVLMAAWRVDKIFSIFPDVLTSVVTSVITILWMAFFLRIYTLMTRHD